MSTTCASPTGVIFVAEMKHHARHATSSPLKSPDWFYVEMMKAAQTRGCQHEDWWLHFSLPDIDELPRVVLPPIEDNRPGSYQLPKERSQGASTRRSTRGEPKDRPRAKSGGSPGATPRHSTHAASTTAADVRHPTPEEPENTERARHVKVEGDGSEATREAGRMCRRARGEKSPSGDWTGLPGYLGPPRAKSIGRKGPRTSPREGLILTQQREMSMGRRGPRIRPRDEDVGGHPADSPPGSRQRMSGHAIDWFMKNMERAFANMDNQQLNRVSETLNTEMDIRESTDETTTRPRGARAGSRAARGAEETAPERPRGGRDASRAGRNRSRPPPRGADTEDAAEEQLQEPEPGSRARSRSKAVTRRRAQWRADHGLRPGRKSGHRRQKPKQLRRHKRRRKRSSSVTPTSEQTHPPGGQRDGGTVATSQNMTHTCTHQTNKHTYIEPHSKRRNLSLGNHKNDTTTP